MLKNLPKVTFAPSALRMMAEFPILNYPNKCPVLTKIVQPSLLKGWCRLICGLLIHDPAG